MPRFLEDKLKAQAQKKGFKGKRAARYVYGAMNNMGAMRGNKETPKGAEMEVKHRAKMHADIAKFKGESASRSFKRPVRKIVRRHVS
jgi:hypothetical protein